MVSRITFKSFVHFEWILLNSISWWFRFIFSHTSFSTPFTIEENVPYHMWLPPLSNISFHYRHGFILELYVPLIHIPALIAIPTILITMALWHSLISGIVIPIALFFFLKRSWTWCLIKTVWLVAMMPTVNFWDPEGLAEEDQFPNDFLQLHWNQQCEYFIFKGKYGPDVLDS